MSTFVEFDHVAAYHDRITDAFREKPVFEALFGVDLAQLQAIEDAAHEVLGMYGLESAEGAWLDVYGRLLDVARAGQTDEAYSTAISLRQQAMQSRGTIPDVLALADAIGAAYSGSPPPTIYRPGGMQSFILEMADLPSDKWELTAVLLGDAAPVGRTVEVIVYDSEYFGFSEDPNSSPLDDGVISGGFLAKG